MENGEEIKDTTALRKLIPDLAGMKLCYGRESLYVMNGIIW